MNRFVDKIAGALGFTSNEAQNERQDDNYEDFEEFEEEDGYQDSRSARNYSRDNGRSSTSSAYAQSSYRTPGSSYTGYTGSSYGSSYGGASYGSSFGSSYGSSYGASSYNGPTYKATSFQTSSSTGANGSKVLNLHASVQMEVVVASPESFDEARVIAASIRDNKPVIINLEFVEHSIAQRMTDFLCGCCCAMDGNIQRIADKIYMIAPGNVDFAGDVDIRQSLQSEGLAFPIGSKEQK